MDDQGNAWLLWVMSGCSEKCMRTLHIWVILWYSGQRVDFLGDVCGIWEPPGSVQGARLVVHHVQNYDKSKFLMTKRALNLFYGPG